MGKGRELSKKQGIGLKKESSKRTGKIGEASARGKSEERLRKKTKPRREDKEKGRRTRAKMGSCKIETRTRRNLENWELAAERKQRKLRQERKKQRARKSKKRSGSRAEGKLGGFFSEARKRKAGGRK